MPCDTYRRQTAFALTVARISSEPPANGPLLATDNASTGPARLTPPSTTSKEKNDRIHLRPPSSPNAACRDGSRQRRAWRTAARQGISVPGGRVTCHL